MSILPRTQKTPQNVGFFDPEKEKEIKKRRALAQQLMSSAQPQETQVVSGIAIPQSSTSGLVKGLQQGIGAYQMGKADDLESKQDSARTQAISDAILGDDPKAAAAALLQDPETQGLAIQLMKDQKGGVGGSTGELLDRLVAEDNGVDSLSDALSLLKGGAGSQGRLNQQILLGNQAEYAKKSGQKRAELEYEPQIKRASQDQLNQSNVSFAGDIAAEKEIGKERGIAEAGLDAKTAFYPKLESAVERLSELGQDATYTMAGRASDAVGRELGFEPGDGAVARAEYQATVDNEVLPLLRQTFGAAFTVAEGDSLRATLGDANKAPAEKDAALRAFIRQKQTELESLQRQTGQPVTGAPQSNQRSRLEELRAKYGQR